MERLLKRYIMDTAGDMALGRVSEKDGGNGRRNFTFFNILPCFCQKAGSFYQVFAFSLPFLSQSIIDRGRKKQYNDVVKNQLRKGF